MFEEGLKTSIWVSAEIRRCDGLFLPMTVVHKGDPDRGLVLIKQYVAGKGAMVFSQRRDLDGKLGWVQPLGEISMEERQADDYIARQRQYDDDLWVLEVDDPRGQYTPDP